MSNNSFFPTTESGQVVWLTHFALKLPTHAAVLGILDEELANTLKDVNYYVWLLQHLHPASQHDAKEHTAFKHRVISGSGSDTVSHPQPSIFPDPPPAPTPGIQKRLFSLIVRIKASPGYTDAIGQDLGVIASPSTTEHPIPESSLAVELGATGPRVRIDFKKYGHDGIWIESRINGGDWAFLAIDTVKPYLDERPITPGNLHETREYRLRWWDKSQPNGEWSAVQKAVLGN
jgi:hypothetical protein